VIDTPTVGTGYGGTVSAPVFAEVAQQVLEYLGVPHDQPLKSQKEMEVARLQKDVFDSSPETSGADLNAMFADVNSLPADDPLRAPAQAPAVPVQQVAEEVAEERHAPVAAAPTQAARTPAANTLSAEVMAAFHRAGDTTSRILDEQADLKTPLIAPAVRPAIAPHGNGVVVDAGPRVAVPSFEGGALRTVVEQAASAGLRVQPIGSGLAREQAPAPGTMVPAGTEVVVRFTR
jgi:cell division protein FtsI (penicillin-binding protein 3)